MNIIRHRGGQETEDSYRGIPIHAAAGVHAKVAELLAGRLPALGRVADLGAGHGALSLRLHDAGFLVEAFDFDVQNWPLREVPCRRFDLNESLQAVRQFGPFEAVCAIEVIEHLENPRRFLKELVSLAAEHGTWLVISTPNPLDTFSSISLFTRGIFNWFSRDHYEGGGHISILPHWLIAKHLEHLGVKNQEWFFLAPYRHPSPVKQVAYRMIGWFRRLVAKDADSSYHDGQTALVIARFQPAKPDGRTA